ncbi:hypothetical protein FF38_08491 [Lucilia cuprina]|uniref:Uncharacterized protein n=1 Tax=Lucilia cuprina TaxID=7375 RepID=A0A0L0BWR3_LUCCU|nr:hypothetical protein FF38_10522 [Lucilia cuprina]KNC31892.1 hypothetical protein FF38_08491 [Lucilia cuprina]
MKTELIANSCRICLTQTKKLRSLYKPIDEGDEPPNEMLHLITGIQVEKLDEHETLPKNICKNCELSLNMAFEFRENALRTQEIIMAYLNELNGYESNEESNKSQISNYKAEYEEIMNLEPLDCVDALEEDIQILSKDEQKSAIGNDEELNEEASGDENPIGEEEEQEEYYKQEVSYILKNTEENENDEENDQDNYTEDQPEEEEGKEEDQEEAMCEEQEEIAYKEQVMTTEQKDLNEMQKTLTKSTNGTKTIRKKIMKLKSNDTIGNMKQISRRGRKPNNSKNENGHICDICGNVFAKLGRMMEHRQRHDKEHRYSCEICNQTFLTRELLRKHMFSHSGGKPLKCKYCSRTFYYESVRRAHEAVHQGHKPYVCDVCDKAFSYAHALKKHKLIHAEIKLYRCEYCAKDFRLQHHLKQHEETRLHQNTVRHAHGAKTYGDYYIPGQDEQDEDIIFLEEIADDQLATDS